MAQRLELHEILVDILQTDHVYFQPPPTKDIRYPCIIYKRDSLAVDHANDFPYALRTRYQLTIIDQDPDSKIPYKVAMLPLCSFERAFATSNLNHDVYNLYF